MASYALHDIVLRSKLNYFIYDTCARLEGDICRSILCFFSTLISYDSLLIFCITFDDRASFFFNRFMSTSLLPVNYCSNPSSRAHSIVTQVSGCSAGTVPTRFVRLGFTSALMSPIYCVYYVMRAITTVLQNHHSCVIYPDDKKYTMFPWLSLMRGVPTTTSWIRPELSVRLSTIICHDDYQYSAVLCHQGLSDFFLRHTTSVILSKITARCGTLWTFYSFGWHYLLLEPTKLFLVQNYWSCNKIQSKSCQILHLQTIRSFRTHSFVSVSSSNGHSNEGECHGTNRIR